MKERTCTDGRKQLQWKIKVEHASPNTYTDSVLLNSVADACEERFVGIADIKGACLSTEFDEFLLITFEKEQVDIMYGIDNEHRKHVVIGRRVLCLVLNKDSCGGV